MSDPPARDGEDWLHRHTAREWLAAAVTELSKAEGAYAQNDARGGLAGARRAAGMALNGVLAAAPDASFGRTYMEHLTALGRDASAPTAVRAAATTLLTTRAPGGGVIGLRSRSGDTRVLEAAKDVLAHAYALIARTESA